MMRIRSSAARPLGAVEEQSILSSRLFLALLVFLLWVPLPMGSNRPWAWALLESWIFVMAGVALLALARGWLQVTPALRRARPIVVLLVLWLVYGLIQVIPVPMSWVEIISPAAAHIQLSGDALLMLEPGRATWGRLSLDVHASLVEWLKSIAYISFFVLVLLLVDSRARLQTLALAVVLAGVFQALYGSMMVLSGLEIGFFQEKSASRGVATGTFVNRNHLAGFLEMTLAVGIGLLIGSMKQALPDVSRRQRLRNMARMLLGPRARLRIFLAIMVIALVLSRSRMGNVAFFLSMLLTGSGALLLFRQATRPVMVLLASLILIDIFILGGWFGVERLRDRIENTSLITEVRDDVNRDLLRQWQDYRLTGSGAGSFYTVFPAYRGAGVSQVFDHAHNDYLELLSEYGLVGILLSAAVVLGCLGAGLRVQWRRRDPLMRGMAFAAVMGIAAMLIHSSVDFNLHIPSNAVYFTLLLALPWLAGTIKKVGVSSGRR